MSLLKIGGYMDNKFYDSFIAVIQKDHIGNIIDIIKKEDDCIRNEDDYIVLPLKEAVILKFVFVLPESYCKFLIFKYNSVLLFNLLILKLIL